MGAPSALGFVNVKSSQKKGEADPAHFFGSALVLMDVEMLVCPSHYGHPIHKKATFTQSICHLRE